MQQFICCLDRQMQHLKDRGRNENGSTQIPSEVLDMRSVKSNLIDYYARCAVILAFALVLGSPLIAAGSAFAQARPQPEPDQAQPPQQPDGSQAKSGTFTGNVVKDGSDYMLRDSSGEVFKLDDPERAKPFEGKTVKVTGELDAVAKVIHVESIEAAEG
jgi:hypothetical protein